MQTMYLLLKCDDILAVLRPLEQFTLLITALCHDLDHMGLNNSFHLRTESPMGILSSSSGVPSVLELHHCKLAIDILSHEECNVFSCLTPDQSVVAYKQMISCILSTDMAKHAETMTKFEELLNVAPTSPPSKQSGEPVNDGGEEPAFNVGAARMRFDSFDRRLLLMQMLMKAVDISNIVKPFEIARCWALLVTEEFCTQGELEKARNLEIQAMFDREKLELAKVQLGFIDFVGVKFWQLLVEALPSLDWAMDHLRKNRSEWSALDNRRKQSAGAAETTY
eukprot:NODE_173_length_1722_cov_4.378960_g119_i0.p1 GENE.NODE_173_length_1722_cov_4.378960_g119_i0~~NODE_173_length_1722_cov_4.378960_g119_i0.p1  ORF type:complete len:280 (-),score=111.11 NODE_173_length_1722_cov_4.378960_g119_i0:591-1430(-)